MKNVSRLIVLIASIPFMLSSCEELKEKKAYCLETYNKPEYESGMCYQACANDVLESVHLINLPINPNDGKGNYQYDIEWKTNVPLSYFTFTEGLVGKKIKSILTLGPNVIRLNIYGQIEDRQATSGYIKVSKEAFKAKTARVKEAYLYAYVAIGDTSDVVEKPVLEQENETNAN